MQCFFQPAWLKYIKRGNFTSIQLIYISDRWLCSQNRYYSNAQFHFFLIKSKFFGFVVYTITEIRQQTCSSVNGSPLLKQPAYAEEDQRRHTQRAEFMEVKMYRCWCLSNSLANKYSLINSEILLLSVYWLGLSPISATFVLAFATSHVD